jgi:hypothetical protein
MSSPCRGSVSTAQPVKLGGVYQLNFMNAPQFSAYPNNCEVVVLGYASPISPTIDPQRKNCSKALIAPIAWEECDDYSYEVSVGDRMGYVNLSRISHVELYRFVQARCETDSLRVEKDSFNKLRHSAKKTINGFFQTVNRPYWKAMFFPDEHAGHHRPVLVVGENLDSGTFLVMLDCSHCPTEYAGITNRFIAVKSESGCDATERFLLSEVIVANSDIIKCTKACFSRAISLPDSSVITDSKRHIIHKQLARCY